MLGGSDLQAAWFSNPGTATQTMGPFRVDSPQRSLLIVEAKPSESEQRSDSSGKPKFCFRLFFKSRGNGGVHSEPSRLCSWASAELSHGADGVKERMWAEREVLLCLKYQWGRCCQVFGSHWREQLLCWHREDQAVLLCYMWWPLISFITRRIYFSFD